MSSMGYDRGHEVECENDGIWYYSDNHEEVTEISRPCKYCGREPTVEGHDACLGTLPNVKHACCGHHISEVGRAYAMFNNGKTLRFKNTEEIHKYFDIKDV